MVRSIVPVEVLSTNNSRPSSIRSFTGEPAPSLPTSSPPSTIKNWKKNQNQNQNNTFLQRSSFHKSTDPDGTDTTARDMTWKTNSFHQTTPVARTPTVVLPDDGDDLDGTNTTARDMTDPEAAAVYRTDSESPPSSADNNKSGSPQTKDDYYDVAASPHIQRLVSPSPLSSSATKTTAAANGREGTTSVSYSTRYATVAGRTDKEADPVGDVRRTDSSESSPSSSSARQAYYDAADTYYVAEPSPMVDRSLASPAAKVTDSVTYSTKYVHEPKYHYTTPNKQQHQQPTKPRHQQPPPQQRLRVVDLPETVPEYQQQQRTAASSSSPDDSKETTPDSKTTTSSGEPVSSASSGASVSRNSNSPPEYYTTTTKTPFFRSPNPAATTKSQQVHKNPTSTTPVALTPSPKSRSSPGEESVLSTMTTDPDGHQIVRKKSQEPDEMSYGEYSSDTRMEEEQPQPRQNNVSWLDSTGGTTFSEYTTETIHPDSTEETITASPTYTATTRSPVVGEVYMTSLKDDTRTTNTKPSSFRTTRGRGGGGNHRQLDFEDDVIDEVDQSYSNHSNVAYTTGGVGDSNHSNVAYTGGVGGAAVAAVALAASGGGTDPDGTLPPSHDDDDHRSMTGESLEPTHNDEYDSFKDASAELNPYEDNDDSSYDEESFEDEGSRDKDDTSDDDDDVVLPNYNNNKDIENLVSSHASSASGGSHSSTRKPEPKHSKFPSVPMLIGMVVFIILGFGGLIAGLTWYLWDKQPLAPFPVPTKAPSDFTDPIFTTDVPTITLVPTDSPTRFMPSPSTPISETFPDDETLLQLFATVFGTNEYSKVFTAVCASERFEFGLLCSTTAGLAANWMLYEDPSRTSTIRRSDEGWIQRYLLVYLYYSTTNDRTTTWLSCNPLSKDAADPSTDTEIVERSSSVDNSCQFTYPTELPGGRVIYDLVPSSRWLSGADECKWGGVACGKTVASDIVMESGTAPTKTSRLAVTSIVLADQFLTGSIVTELMELPQLELLDLSHNGLKGMVSEKFRSLRTFRAQYNVLSGSIPSNFFDSSSTMTELNIGSNYLIGTIPNDIGLSSQMKDLYLFDNEFTGTIPALGNMPLVTFQGQGNKFNGGLPFDLNYDGAWTDTIRVWWSYQNEITGTIPNNIQFLTNLQELRLQDNELTGTIPETISELSNLYRFEVQSNSLTGTVPEGIGSLQDLSIVKVQFNPLTGIIPTSLCYLESMKVLEANCDDTLSASILPGITTTECYCCTTCCNPILEECLTY